VFKQMFCLSNYNREVNYRCCYIRHPDVWGEPRNLMTAIAAISQCVKGKLICEFSAKDELAAFQYLVTCLTSAKLSRIYRTRVGKSNRKAAYHAEWVMQRRRRVLDMSAFYSRNQRRILSRLYTQYPSLSKKGS
jgi:hypothetical protein